MKFDVERPTLTDHYRDGAELKWARSKEADVYYFWTQPVPVDVSFDPQQPPVEVDLEHGNRLFLYKSPSRVELLYRFHIAEKPERFHQRLGSVIFWTYGKEGGASNLIKYLYRDRNLTLHKWADKESYLAVIKSVAQPADPPSFWSR